ncbi:hypothetical protein F5Y18DRAFT_274660 [Xylariaceae sp. FL1019]|nr:hypothetical protein F5Y18DRAFT_274660 [Xylariaceae sp. FL1019]
MRFLPAAQSTYLMIYFWKFGGRLKRCLHTALLSHMFFLGDADVARAHSLLSCRLPWRGWRSWRGAIPLTVADEFRQKENHNSSISSIRLVSPTSSLAKANQPEWLKPEGTCRWRSLCTIAIDCAATYRFQSLSTYWLELGNVILFHRRKR